MGQVSRLMEEKNELARRLIASEVAREEFIYKLDKMHELAIKEAAHLYPDGGFVKNPSDKRYAFIEGVKWLLKTQKQNPVSGRNY